MCVQVLCCTCVCVGYVCVCASVGAFMWLIKSSVRVFITIRWDQYLMTGWKKVGKTKVNHWVFIVMYNFRFDLNQTVNSSVRVFLDILTDA